jgi:hypothetical protein
VPRRWTARTDGCLPTAIRRFDVSGAMAYSRACPGAQSLGPLREVPGGIREAQASTTIFLLDGRRVEKLHKITTSGDVGTTSAQRSRGRG